MALEVVESIAKTLPSSVKNALAKMTAEDQAVFEEEYKKKMKSPVAYTLIAIFFPIHYFLLGKIGLGLAFWFTAAGLGIWWFVDIFRIRGIIRRENEEAATKQLRDMKIMAQ